MMAAIMAMAEGWLLPIVLWLVMFSMGLGLRIDDFRHVVVNSRAFALGVGSMLVLVPAIGVTLAVAFAPTPALMMGLILLATCPGGILSNLMTDLARGNVALSLSMSLFVSLTYVFTLPVIASVALDFVFGRSAAVPVPMLTSFVNIVMVTLVPVMVGMAVRAVVPRLASALEPRVKSVATSVLVGVFALIVAQQWATLTASFGIVLAIVVAMNLANLAIAYLVCALGRLQRADRVAIAMEHIVRQEGTAIFVAVTLLHRSDMSLPMIVNTFIGMAIGIPAVARLRRRAAPAALSPSIKASAS
jgi:BASS family bile acid:Na+ symporter